MFTVMRSALIAMLLIAHGSIAAGQANTASSPGGHSSNVRASAGKRSPDAAGQLDTYLQELKKVPADQSLRKTIIRLVATMKSAPEIPDEARRHFMTAMGMMKAATTPEGAALAVAEYQQTLVLAPWWGEAYLRESEALQLGKRYAEAIEALDLYMLAEPENAEEARNRIYQLQGEQKVAAVQEEKGSAERPASEKPHQAGQVVAGTITESTDDPFIRGLNGARYGWSRDTSGVHQSATFEIRGNKVFLRWEESTPDDKRGPAILREQFSIVGRNFVRSDPHSCSIIFSGAQHCSCRYTIHVDIIEAVVVLDGKDMPPSGAGFGICRGPSEIPRNDEPH
jgi:hypothetical protein